MVKLVPFFEPMGSQTETNRAWLHAFSRAWCRLHVFASSSDWLIVLFTFFVIGRTYYFGFSFTTVNWKLLYIIDFIYNDISYYIETSNHFTFVFLDKKELSTL